MSDKIRLGIIFGGKSGEHEVSLMSAASVINAVDKSKYQVVCIGITKEGEWLLFEGASEDIENGRWEEQAKEMLKNDPKKYRFNIIGSFGLKTRVDIAFPVLHGPFGEDGTIQGLFEMADIPYVGAGVLGSSAAMDKACSKIIFEQVNLPICKYKVILRSNFEKNREDTISLIEKEFQYPMFVKPSNLGSSVGITKAHHRKELIDALLEACRHDRKILIEEFVNCREIETSVIGNDDLRAAAVGEIIPSKEFYDYEAKYFDGGKSKLCIPADISDFQKDQIRTYAIKAYQALDCCGFARVDFFIEKDTGEVLINEINTIPGFTRYSMLPLSWKEQGIDYPQLIDKLIIYGLERYKEKQRCKV